MLGSGCKEGVEMRRAWEKLTEVETEAREWLGSEVGEVFNVPLAGLGKGSVTGETRKKIISAKEDTLALLLAKALDLHRPSMGLAPERQALNILAASSTWGRLHSLKC